MQSRADLEEERRLFYVALTRAQKRATLSYAVSRYKWGNLTAGEPSRFIDEIDPKYLQLPALHEQPLDDRGSRRPLEVAQRVVHRRPLLRRTGVRGGAFTRPSAPPPRLLPPPKKNLKRITSTEGPPATSHPHAGRHPTGGGRKAPRWNMTASARAR